jgi:hypothetical protein
LRISQAVRKRSPNGEIHFILPEQLFDETGETAEDVEAELRKITKREASKPLLLLRAE